MSNATSELLETPAKNYTLRPKGDNGGELLEVCTLNVVVPDADNWVYRLDSSNDGGRSWNEGIIEFTFRRSK